MAEWKEYRKKLGHKNLPAITNKYCRTDESCNLKRNLGFRLHDVVNSKEQTVLESIKNEKIFKHIIVL